MFISIEGGEGSGKTTQIKHMERYFEFVGRSKCIVTLEPGGTKIGDKIRAILVDPDSTNMDYKAELLLYMASRALHISEVILPNLTEGNIVLCDRFFDSSVVYQGFARGLGVEFVQELHKLVFENLKPDLTFFLDIDAKLGLERAWKDVEEGDRSEKEMRFEQETIDFHEKLRQGFLELVRTEPGRFVAIDASKDEHIVRQKIFCVLDGIKGGTKWST